MTTNAPVLLVEDDMVDVLTIKRAFKENKIDHPVASASNGEEAIKYLQSNPKPSLIILDLNMPRMNGLEFMKNIKESKELATIPVIVLTTSNEKRDVEESFRLGAAGYLVKPIDYRQFVEMIKTVFDYWKLNRIPN